MVWRSSSLRSSVIEAVIDTESSWIPRKVMAVAGPLVLDWSIDLIADVCHEPHVLPAHGSVGGQP